MDGGRIVAQGTPAQLKAAVGSERLDLTIVDTRAFDQVSERLGPRAVHGARSTLTLGVACSAHADAVRGLLDELDPAHDLITHFSIHTASLDDVFLSLTGRKPNPESEIHDA